MEFKNFPRKATSENAAGVYEFVLFCSLHLIIFYIISTNLHETQGFNLPCSFCLYVLFISKQGAACANALPWDVPPIPPSVCAYSTLNGRM